MEINILISTLNERIADVPGILLPKQDDVEYIVSHQYTSERYKPVPAALKRADVTISQIKGKGVAKSRNNAIQLATGDVAILSDDDVTYRPEYVDAVRQTFSDHPEIDIALFKIKTEPGEPEYKRYPAEQKLIKNKLSRAVSTIEIAFRIERIKERGVYFDERFGAGQELIINTDETIFIEDCLKRGCKVLYVPEYVVEHPYISTRNLIPKYDERLNWVVGAYDCRTNGKIAMLKALLGTIKYLPDLIRHKVNPLAYCYQRLSAVLYILRTNKKTKGLLL